LIFFHEKVFFYVMNNRSSPPTKRARVTEEESAPRDATMSNAHSADEPASLYEPCTSASLALYKSNHSASIRDISAYWSELAKSKLDWYAPFPAGVTGSFVDGSVSWFAGGKLNVCYNAVDRYCLPPYNRGDETAIIWEGDEPDAVKRISYRELQLSICRIANALKASGVQKGDVVTLYMPMVPELCMTMLACARIGAVHSVIFAGFSADAIADRIHDAKSKWVVTASAGSRGGRNLPLKSICDAAVKKSRCVDIVQKVFVFDGKGPDGSEWEGEAGLHVRFSDLVQEQRPVCSCEWMDAEDPLFILYTSGSTGRPKGLVHTTGGYALYAMHTTANSFGLSQQTGPSSPDDPHKDVYACVADAGWITGHTYIVYGPLLNGVSTFMFESTPMYPDHGRYWDMVQRHKITVFYTAPTAIRSLMRYGDEAPNKYDLSSLQVLGTVGEPINPAAWKWYYDVIGKGKCAVVDTYWQVCGLIAFLRVLQLLPLSCVRPVNLMFCVEIQISCWCLVNRRKLEATLSQTFLASLQ